MQNKSQQTAVLTSDDFIANAAVKQCILDLKAAFTPDGKGLIISDVLDENGNQYVNLVQKGGGVLGMALVGYTYVLEQMGIRFIRLAGTSAGAINTALMTVIGNKHEPKSIGILDAICKLDFFKLVDGHPAAQWVIKKFITNENFTEKLKKWIITFLSIFVILFLGNIIFLGLQHTFPRVAVLTKIFFVLSGISVTMLVLICYYISTLLQKLKNAGYGINPGDYFYDWIKDVHICDLAGKQINIDGKTLRGALNKKGNCNIHIVHAWVHEEGMLIGQLKTDEKSNEITAIPELLDMIDIKGSTVTIDAIMRIKSLVFHA